MAKAHYVGFIAFLSLAGGTALAFNGHIVTEGPVRLTIGDIEEVTQYNKPQDVAVRVRNNGQSPLGIQLRMAGLVDEWYAVGETQRQLEISPGTQAEMTFQIAAGQGTCSALYPVHIYATFQQRGRTVTAHAVQIFESSFRQTLLSSREPPETPVNIVPANGALPLWPLRTYRVAWRYYEQPLVYMPVGWQGSSPRSSATFARGRVTRSSSKQSLTMHPPWKPRGGSIFAEYLLKMPNTVPIRLRFANAIRDHTASEPASDGVTFRVWAGEKKLFERHTLSKQWIDAEVDLSGFAGKKVLLRLESHPGPKRDTTCDSSYWGEPVIIAGVLPQPPSPAEAGRLRGRARNIVESAKASSPTEFAFKLDGQYVAGIALGQNGLADCAIGLGKGGRNVVFDGFQIAVLGHSAGTGASPITVRHVGVERGMSTGKLIVTHHLVMGSEEFDLTAKVWKERAGLRIRLECPKRITDFALGRADQKAPRVYYGHGYCIVEPEAFRAGFGGHNLSTSHVGFDFERGSSLLVACDNPPDYLEVNPEGNMYSLHTHLDATMTLVPSAEGAFDCARKYRPLFDKEASPGLRRKAGRFVFDIWGGRYAEIAETMRRMIEYGLTDSLLTLHVWQRWGYDYRLPDIYPPQPQLGTVREMQRIAKICAEHDIPWGLHDNYIDFYPDAADYSYDHICFTEEGEPVRAWLNEGRDAQSYRWRPDHIMPFVKRNLRLIKPDLRPTHYFIDVFTSLPCFDYYDKDGDFHSMLETRKCWGEAFAWIRDYLGDNAPMTSEAGHDQLTGYLDGSDCQHLTLSPVSERFCIRLGCDDWERVPWFDAVLHDKFSLHGVGYPSRYKLEDEQSRSRVLESDDYISAEILEGHALMIDRRGFGPGAVRKYWLAQDFVRSIAQDRIESVEFAEGDIHRQVVAWESGAKVYVNRGKEDWDVAGKCLPQYGYFAKSGVIESSIERIDGIIVEQSRGPSGYYFNARGYSPDGGLAIRPVADRVEYLGGRRFKLIVNWAARQAAPKDLDIFIHFGSNKSQRRDRIVFQSGGKPMPGTSKWQGNVSTGANWIVEVPRSYGAGEYEITIGLWDPSTGRRYGLDGDDDGGTRYKLGTLVAEGTEVDITDIHLVKHKLVQKQPSRWNANRIPVDFGPVATEGAFRCELRGREIAVTPLPKTAPFAIAMRLDRLTEAKATDVKSVVAVDAEGETIRDVEFEKKGHVLEFLTRENEFAYRVLTGTTR
jgi:hypothetical protein